MARSENPKSVQDVLNEAFDTGADALKVLRPDAGAQAADNQSATWANSASADTEKDIDVSAPSPLQPDGLYVVSVHNPSTETALTAAVKGVESMGAGPSTMYPELTRFNVPANEDHQVVVQGWLVNGGRLTLSNDSALSGSGGFTAYVTVRKV